MSSAVFLILNKNSAKYYHKCTYRGANKSLARPGRKQAKATKI